jgi:hypothetical protein
LTMKTNSPTTSPTRPKKAKPTQTETFDDINDVRATIGHSPVPEGTPTHPFLYHGALAYGSPKKSKLANLMLPTTPTSGDDQKIIKTHPTITKKKRTFSNKSGATTDDDIDSILKEMCDLDSPISDKSDKKAPKKPKDHHHQALKKKNKKKPTLACQLKKLPTLPRIQRLLLPPSTVHRPTLVPLVPTQLSLFMRPIQRLMKHSRPLQSAGSLFSRTVSTMLSLAMTSDQLQPLLTVPSQPIPTTKMMIANPPRSLSSEFRPSSGRRANLCFRGLPLRPNCRHRQTI